MLRVRILREPLAGFTKHLELTNRPISEKPGLVLLAKSTYGLPDWIARLIFSAHPSAEVTEKHIKLIVCELNPPVSPYATLSHCWGKANIFKCDTANLEAMQKEIRYDELPLTFQHAMTTVRNLGIRYIWIDSLCIIQNSKDDWLKEAATMGDVYQRALLNLAATHGKDSNAGLFSSQHPQTSSGVFEVNEPVSGSDVIELIVTNDVEVPSEPLNKRGWVFQERLLSGRIVHFFDGYALWDCAQLTAWEQAPSGEVSGEIVLPVLKRGNNPLMDNNLTFAWGNIIDAYSACNFTYGSDKLIAISGIAQILAARFGDQYIKGLWRTDLEEQLCWKALGPRSGARIKDLPSWTWASLNDTKAMQSRLGSFRVGKSAVRNPRAASIVNIGEPFMEIQIRCVCHAMTFTSRTIWDKNFETRFINPSVSPDLLFTASHDTTDTECVEDLLYAILHAEDSKISGLLIKPVKGAISTYTRRGMIERRERKRDLSRVEKPWYEECLVPTPGECTKCQEHDDRLGCLITLV
ncbi:heterokaryon incompatibility protein-domain-containing protein [Apiospora arundinis]|uniref:Heterokaryon incompatibility protein-domain-containing protein n=1 Tax=Apiospora arundinis TaxID=335852 RepID=A0ABR2I898_9PEZI